MSTTHTERLVLGIRVLAIISASCGLAFVVWLYVAMFGMARAATYFSVAGLGLIGFLMVSWLIGNAISRRTGEHRQ